MKTINSVSLWYVGFILTSGLSLVLSVLLFTSVSDSRLSWIMLAGIALALELGKILSIQNKNSMVAGLLIAVSVMGSAGGLSSAITVTDASVDSQAQQKALLMAQIDQTRRTIEQNNQAIDRYIKLNQIRRDAQPLQEKNRKLNDELTGLIKQLNSLESVEVPELMAVFNLLSTLLLMPVEWVRSLVVLLLAGLLDALTVSFVREGVLVVVDEPEFQNEPEPEPEPEDKLPLPKQDPEHHEAPQLTASAAPANVTAMDNSYPSFKRMMLTRRDAGHGVLAQRACIREMNLKDRQVRGFFHRLQSEGVIEKGNRGQFVFTALNEQKVMKLV